MKSEEAVQEVFFMSHPLVKAVQCYIDAVGWKLSWRQYQAGQCGCCVTFDMDHASYKTFFDVDMQRNFFSVTSYAPNHIPECARSALAELLTRINYELFLSKFEMDFSDGELRVSSSICIEGGQLTQGMIGIMENCVLTDLDHYFPAIQAIVDEGLTALRALEKVACISEEVTLYEDGYYALAI
ncbi:MAG: hypothetical protein RL563_243 [Pseudomonadota bacterium]